MTIRPRSINNPSLVAGVFPKPNRPAAMQSSTEYKQLTRQERIASEGWADNLIKGSPINAVPLENINTVIITLKERKRQAILKGNYTQSQEIENMIGRLGSIIIQRKHANIKAQEIKAIEYQLQQAENQLKKTIQAWNEKAAEFNKTQAISARRIERTQFARLNDNDSIPTDTLPSKYLKPSAKLLDLRERERHLVLTKRYDEATLLHKEGDRMEKEEELEKKREFLHTSQRQRQQLLMAQERDRQGFQERWSRSAEKLQKQMEKEIEQQRRVVENIRTKLNDAKNETV
jgi:hypothetical protein